MTIDLRARAMEAARRLRFMAEDMPDAGYAEDAANGAALLEELATKVPPEGWQVVPKEPTEEMIDKARGVTASWLNIEGSGLTIAREKMRLRYRAMLAIAPSPSDTEKKA